MQIIFAALNTKNEFQVAVTPAEMCKHLNEVDRTSENPRQSSEHYVTRLVQVATKMGP